MNLLKEYIRLIIKEVLEEDVNLKRLKPYMIGIYAFAQAINKLITEGRALPGTLSIDIIDAGRNLRNAPLTTSGEREGGKSFQSGGNSFKLYLDPSNEYASFDPENEAHDLIHAFTGNIAKAFGKRNQNIKKSGKYAITPSSFNKIVIDQKKKKAFNDAFQEKHGFTLKDDVFTKAITSSDREKYIKWFISKYGEKINKSVEGSNPIAPRLIAHDLYTEIKGDDFRPGYFVKRHSIQTTKSEQKPSFEEYHSGQEPTSPFGMKYDTVYNQSLEDEEEIGGIMIEKIKKYIEMSKPIEGVKTVVDEIMNKYNESAGLTKMSPKEFTHRWDTPEVIDSMTRLFEIYNELLPRYMAAARKAQPENRREMYKNYTKQVSAEQLAAARERYNK